MYKIISHKEYMVSQWSGGKTTQLYIYPENSSYAERNFQFRLSSATVETEISTFTKLEGINRILMVLKGSMKLVHENEHEACLKPYDTDEFEGDWDTKSFGKVEDFNLMYKNCDGMISSFELPKDFGYTTSLEPAEYNTWEFFYSIDGDLCYTIGQEEGVVPKGDLLVIDNNSLEEIDVTITNKDENVVRGIRVSITEEA